MRPEYPLPRTLGHAIAQDESLDWLVTNDPLAALMPAAQRMALYQRIAVVSLTTGASLCKDPDALALAHPPLPAAMVALLRQALARKGP